MPDDIPELTYLLLVRLTRKELKALQRGAPAEPFEKASTKLKAAVDALLQAGREGEGQ